MNGCEGGAGNHPRILFAVLMRNPHDPMRCELPGSTRLEERGGSVQVGEAGFTEIDISLARALSPGAATRMVEQ